MYEKTDAGRAEILKSLVSLKELHKLRPASFNMQILFNAKADEIINIFKEATPNEKTEVIETLNLIDPSNANKYSKITEAK
jgi:cephalosporin-C deacetylase-like acetyl esterase